MSGWLVWIEGTQEWTDEEDWRAGCAEDDLDEWIGSRVSWETEQEIREAMVEIDQHEALMEDWYRTLELESALDDFIHGMVEAWGYDEERTVDYDIDWSQIEYRDGRVRFKRG
ncbi:MAG TPA: hypothetical protein VFL91_27355 [Thermomicrobiales bacterium]|nr:hypothetical protein [Thermomicrobiales bacterium]